MPRTALAGLLLACLTGCSLTRPEPFAAEYRPGGETHTQVAPRSTTYALYRVADAANYPGRELRAQVHVYKGCAVGFGQGDDGKPAAVAGSNTFPLGEGWYRWEDASAETQAGVAEAFLYYPRHFRDGLAEPTRATIEKVGLVIALPFVAAAIVVLFPFVFFFGLPFGPAR